MRDLTIWICTFIALATFFVSLAGFELSISPFKLKFNNWIESLGFILIIIGIFMIRFGVHTNAYKKGIDHTIRDVKEIVGIEKTIEILQKSLDKDKR